MTAAALRLPTTPSLARGLLLLAAGIFTFTAMDAVAKHLVATYPTIEVVWARNLGQLVVVVIYLRRRLAQVLVTRMPVLHLARSVTQLATVGLFFWSLTKMGLAEATALADINPMLITLGAALFLGESLGRARILGVVLAAFGAMVILRPGMGVFSVTAGLPLLAAVAYAANVLITRKVGLRESPWGAMVYSALFGTIITTLPLPLYFAWPSTPDLFVFALLGLLGTVAQFLIISAYSRTQASILSPFGYLDMVFATLWSIAVFHSWPDGPTLIGALVIALAGLYVWRTETALSPTPETNQRQRP